MARVILIIALTLVVVMGMTAVGCNGDVPDTPNGDVPNGDIPNGDEPNGDEPNGDEPNGDEPNGDEPDLSTLGLVVDCDPNTSGEEPEVGDIALDFRFQDAAGTTFSLSDFRGTLVILNFWAVHCGFCVAEVPHIQQIYEQWPATDVVLLTIPRGDEPAEVATFMQEHELSFPVLIDEGRIVSGEYDVNGIPTTFFIDEEGVIQFIQDRYFENYEEIVDVLNQLLGQ